MKCFGPIVLAVAGGLGGCEKEETKPSGAVASDDQGIGIAECDEYVVKMTECLAKMPEQARAGAEPAFKQNRENWKKAAAEGVELGPTCKAALDSVANNPLCK